MTIMSAYRGPSILASHLCLMAASCGWDGGLIPDVVYSGEMPEARLSFEPMSPGVNAYKLLTSIIVPRPIAWISSLSIEGIGNLAPHSFFTVASADPPIVQFTSVGSKDTLRNVIATEEFVINLASVDLADFVNQSSAPYPPNVDEAQELGMITEPSEKVAPMRVSSSPASIECRLHSTVSMGIRRWCSAMSLLFRSGPTSWTETAPRWPDCARYRAWVEMSGACHLKSCTSNALGYRGLPSRENELLDASPWIGDPAVSLKPGYPAFRSFSTAAK